MSCPETSETRPTLVLVHLERHSFVAKRCIINLLFIYRAGRNAHRKTSGGPKIRKCVVCKTLVLIFFRRPAQIKTKPFGPEIFGPRNTFRLSGGLPNAGDQHQKPTEMSLSPPPPDFLSFGPEVFGGVPKIVEY